MTSDFELRLADVSTVLADADFVARWRQLLDAHGQPNQMYGSPEWVGHLANARDLEITVWSLHDDKGELVGVVPVRKRAYELKYDVYCRLLFKKTFRVAEVLGGEPCMPQDDRLCRRLMGQILGAWKDCDGVYFDSLPAGGFCSRVLHRMAIDGKTCQIYSPFGRRLWHLVDVCSSFEVYLQSMSSKGRSNLRRQVRRLDALGRLDVREYVDSEQIPQFLQDASRIGQRTWQSKILGSGIRDDDATQGKLRDAARRGLLRSYVLHSGATPCAFVMGYQYKGVYHYADVGFDSDMADFSPGAVLLYLVLESLHRHNPPMLLNFGVGEAHYKKRFGNRTLQDEAILIVRNGLRNRAALSLHRAFMASVGAVKRMLRIRSTK